MARERDGQTEAAGRGRNGHASVRAGGAPSSGCLCSKRQHGNGVRRMPPLLTLCPAAH
jgi:hypothetical protein